eukprot:COSAG01_NODE_9215_length_2516_cov_1.788581_1_plen_435_part_00
MRAVTVATCALATSLVAAASGALSVPATFMGTWTGNIDASPLGPDLPGWGGLIVSTPGKDGSVYMKHVSESQLFRIHDGLAQYCFDYDQATAGTVTGGADEAPFVVAGPIDDAGTDAVLQLCWRGRRLPSHAPNCTGCACAAWTLKLTGGVLHSTFQMSPPATHMGATLSRTGPAPTAEALAGNWNCTFDNATQHPKHPLVASKGAGLSLSCPFLAREQPPQQVAQPDALGAVTNCLVLTRERHNVRLEYLAEKLPCMPCDVTFTLSIDTSPNSYVSLGFKETYAAYFDWDKIGDYPDYWGMSTHDNGGRNVTELGGRIIAGYAHKSPRTGCVREMVADEYVGSVKDTEPDGVIRDKSITLIDGRTELKFTAHLHAGRTASELSWQSLSGFGKQRIMWATGTVGGSGDCSAPLDYHAGARGMASLNFPGFGSPC